MRLFERLEARAREKNKVDLDCYEAEVEAFKIRKAHVHEEAEKGLKTGGTDLSDILAIDEPVEPPNKRFMVSDATYEALGSILAANPNGLLAFRDEIISLLSPWTMRTTSRRAAST